MKPMVSGKTEWSKRMVERTRSLKVGFDGVEAGDVVEALKGRSPRRFSDKAALE